MTDVVVLAGQNILDICMQHAGSITAMIDVCNENDINPTDELTPGQILRIPTVIDKNVVDRFADNIHKPATGSTANIQATPGGIGYMEIENTFIVS